ncbi:MAG: alpha/beta fold hydrolase, partial [Rhodobacteraceae bacterium]|nr:alpha/beta fold hydrolase [Paracoccaceae bacterium]
PGRELADPARHFVAADVDRFDSAEAFRAALGRALEDRTAEREAVIYVHGFNNTFADGLFRIAQIAHDLQAPAVTVHYSWPSAGNPLRYAYDRDSVLIARDGLVSLIRTVKESGAVRIFLVAHSMGALLTMEALRQLDIARPGAARALVHGVVLFSPDIDVELFRAQAAAIRALPDPFVIFTSRRDRALGLSARLTGRNGERLGNLKDFDEVADLDVVLFDVSAFQTGGFNHFALARSPTLLRLFGSVREIDAALGADQAGRTGLFPGTVLTLQNATAIVLSPVTGGLP